MSRRQSVRPRGPGTRGTRSRSPRSRWRHSTGACVRPDFMNAEAKSSSGSSIESRHAAREASIQMLYQWEVGRAPMSEIPETFWAHPPEGAPLTEELRAFATALATGTAEHVAALDLLITEAAEHWRIERMNV